MKPTSPGTNPASRHPRLWLIPVLMGAFIFAVLLTSKGEPKALLVSVLFPMGLQILFQGTAFASDENLLNIVCIVGWVWYLGMALTIILSRRRWLVILLIALFAALLSINVVGCKYVTDTFDFGL